MSIVGRNRLKWKDNDLFYQDQRVMAVYQKDDDSRLWQVGWNDGTLSVDYYNKTRAKEHAIVMALKELNNGVEESEQDV